MNNYQNAREGLRNIFEATIGMIICIFVSIIPVLGILGIIGVIVFVIKILVGRYRVGKDIKACKVAFILQMVSIVVGIGAEFLSLLDAIDLVTGLFPFVADIILIVSVTKLMRERGAASVAKLGTLSLWFSIGFTIGSVICTILFVVLAFMDLSGLALLILLVPVGLAIADLVFYLRFLRNSAEQLGASV